MTTRQGLNGTVALVTGASSGIGEAAALMLAQHGTAVAIGARRKDRLDELRQELTGRHVLVSLVEPGAVATELTSHSRLEVRPTEQDG
jgi:NADP-dependent 3-hydroxy acid dehydrogenase YdfG